MNTCETCPYISYGQGQVNVQKQQIHAMDELRATNIINQAQNSVNMENVWGLPNSSEKRKAITAIQEATDLCQKAIDIADQSTTSSKQAIGAYEEAARIVMSVCPGEPRVFSDPNRAGEYIIKCASPAVPEDFGA